jgi:hypothetical protein
MASVAAAGNGHINVYAMEQRTQMIAGQPPMTITREVVLRNGKGRKTVKVARGSHVVSNVTENLNLSECRDIQRRKYIKPLYKSVESKTIRRMNRPKSKATVKSKAKSK